MNNYEDNLLDLIQNLERSILNVEKLLDFILDSDEFGNNVVNEIIDLRQYLFDIVEQLKSTIQ